MNDKAEPVRPELPKTLDDIYAKDVKTWERFPNFAMWEFESPDYPGSGKFMRVSFMEKLQNARELAGVPFTINSGYRTPAHNKNVGGLPDSSHIQGYAADIAVGNSRHRFIIIQALIAAGFTRIGVGANFIHVDNDSKKPPRMAWVY